MNWVDYYIGFLKVVLRVSCLFQFSETGKVSGQNALWIFCNMTSWFFFRINFKRLERLFITAKVQVITGTNYFQGSFTMLIKKIWINSIMCWNIINSEGVKVNPLYVKPCHATQQSNNFPWTPTLLSLISAIVKHWPHTNPMSFRNTLSFSHFSVVFYYMALQVFLLYQRVTSLHLPFQDNSPRMYTKLSLTHTHLFLTVFVHPIFSHWHLCIFLPNRNTLCIKSQASHDPSNSHQAWLHS